MSDSLKFQVFRNTVVKDQDSFRVIYDNRLCSPNFNSLGAAYAYLSLLQKGYREPEYTPLQQ